jgi:fatty-acyl-CoA synthase
LHTIPLNLYLVIVAGGPTSRAFLQYVRSKMRAKETSVAYGVTETCAAGTMTPVGCSDEQLLNTVGVPRPHVEIKLVDGFRNIVPRGQPGEVCIRSYATMLKYWNDEQATKESLDGSHWFHTGDLGILREDGYLQIVGRVDDVIVRGGEKLSPVEIEQAVMRHGAVVEAQVVGVPDKRMGEEICAFVVLRLGQKATEDEIRQWLSSRISKFKIPKYFVFVTQFPTTVTGRVRKVTLREHAINVLKLGK